MDEFLKSHPMVSWMLAGVAFLVAFVLILKIIEIAVDLRRRLPRGPRSRQLRLGFVETFELEGDRQLMLVRRDNIEHLVLIGGPNDVLIESGIVRVEAREGRTPRGAEAHGNSAAPVLVPVAAAVAAATERTAEPPPTRAVSPAVLAPSVFAPQSPPSFARGPVPAAHDASDHDASDHDASYHDASDDFVSPPLIAAIEAELAAPPSAPADEPELAAALKRAAEQTREEDDLFAKAAPAIEKTPAIEFQAPPPVETRAPATESKAPAPVERPAPRFQLPPRPAPNAPPKPFSPPPPRFPSSAPAFPAGLKGEEPPRPRFVMPPIARRANPPAGSDPLAPPPLSEPPASRSPVFAPPPVEAAPPRPPAPAPAAPKPNFGAAYPGVPRAPSAPAAAPPPPPPPAEPDFEPLETLEEEMAKLLGRPLNK